MPRMTGGQAVVAALMANGARLAFGIPGLHNLPIYDALVDQPQFQHVLARNEQGASLMANAVGRATGQPGVCIVTTGPAACNALCGVGDARRDHVPMLVIASQIKAKWIGKDRGAFHELPNQAGMFEAAGAATFRPLRVAQIPEAISDAWVAMTHGRPGPAYVEIPQDVLFGEEEAAIVAAPPPPRPGATFAEISAALELLQKAQRPLILVGGGAARAGAGALIAALAERYASPIVSTPHGKGTVPDDHPLCAGALPLHDPSCQHMFERSDFLLALGTSFSEVTTNGWRMAYPRELVHVDIDRSVIHRSVPARVGIVGDVKTVVAQLLSASEGFVPPDRAAWNDFVTGLPGRLNRAAAGEPGLALIQIMCQLLPRDAILVGDAQQWGGWPLYHMPVYQAGQMLYPLHFGTLGYSVPGAIGAQAAFPQRRVVAMCGDGGFLFCAQELATAVQHHLPVIVILVNNRGFGTIRYLQEKLYGPGRVTAADLQNPDFVAFVRSFGCFAQRVERMEDFGDALRSALSARQPVLLEITYPIPPTPRDYGLAGSEKQV